MVAPDGFIAEEPAGASIGVTNLELAGIVLPDDQTGLCCLRFILAKGGERFRPMKAWCHPASVQLP